jgi:hypothetical protein
MSNKWLAVLLIVYFIFSVFLVNKYLPNTDAVSYISIAQKYAHGDFKNAINGFWSPLFSWLLAPFLLLRIDATLMARILGYLIGGLLLAAIFLLSSRFALRPFLRITIGWAFIPIVLYYAYDMINPDCLVAALLALYFFVIFDPSYSEKKYAGPACAVLAALAYLAKNYAFYFFLVHFSIFNFLHYLLLPRGKPRKVLLSRYALSLLVFFLISGSWITALSLKYRKLTVSNAASVNFSIIAPRGGGEVQRRDGFVAPPNSTAVSAWEDPTFYPRIKWSPFQSKADFSYWIHLMQREARRTLVIFQDFSFLALPIILASLLLSLMIHRHRMALLGLLTIALYSSGYISVMTLERYLWIDQILLFLLGGYLVTLLIKQGFFAGPVPKFILTSVLVLTFLILPYKFYVKNHHHFYVAGGVETDEDIYRFSQKLKTCCPVLGNVASDSHWSKMVFLAYYLDFKYYGAKKPRITPVQLEEDLERFKIDYYFLWSGNPRRYKFLKPECEITHGLIPQLKIFRLGSLCN